ncbi:glycosyltransferase family 25 [Colletotrichum gloeosporioides Cg-14]|uniref:Glycosyltransferase family 25 n=1 Tax=Colletotrichum gloeosporioides (strain Cg-14) TaxID=1237896 RepID=T0K8F4_COLGC|nr:glycosyltransferase family 25 [Colletotrichum gloeosporioides Cg-14]
MSMLGTFSEFTNNETFGFAKTFLINLPTRYDYLDAATIQAFLSGVQFEVFPAVEGDVSN